MKKLIVAFLFGLAGYFLVTKKDFLLGKVAASLNGVLDEIFEELDRIESEQ